MTQGQYVRPSMNISPPKYDFRFSGNFFLLFYVSKFSGKLCNLSPCVKNPNESWGGGLEAVS